MPSAQQKPLAGTEHEFLKSIVEPLAVLLRAYGFAVAAGADIWQFAVDLNTLWEAGLTTTDLRMLVVKEYVTFARETTRPGSVRRSFGAPGRLPLTRRTCVVLTPAGAALAGRAKTPEPFFWAKRGSGRGGSGLKPHWDRAGRQLRVAGLLVKHFHQPAQSQETVLDALAELGWVPEIDDPLPRVPGVDPKRRLHDTVNSLNRRQKHRLIHFSAAGNGTRIGWRLLLGGAPPELH